LASVSVSGGVGCVCGCVVVQQGVPAMRVCMHVCLCSLAGRMQQPHAHAAHAAHATHP
jgi:hypothetical protein